MHENLNIYDLNMAIERATGVSVYPDLPQIKPWLDIIFKLSSTFNKEGGKKSTYDTIKNADAYCLYFFPVNVVRMCSLFQSIVEENPNPIKKILDSQKISVWDVGCGPGTSSFAFTQTFTDVVNKTSFLLIDANFTMLTKAQKVLNNKNAYGVCKDLSAPVDELIKRYGYPDIITMANVLTEVEKPNLDQYFDSGAKLIIMMEPASVPNSRRLLKIRDNVLSMFLDKYKLIYPCTVQTPCPALLDEKNWCHMSTKWERPAWIRTIDKHLGFNKTELDFTPVVFMQREMILDDPDYANSSRIVSDPSRKKWGTEVYLCGNKGLYKETIDKKEAKRLKRGLLLV